MALTRVVWVEWQYGDLGWLLDALGIQTHPSVNPRFTRGDLQDLGKRRIAELTSVLNLVFQKMLWQLSPDQDQHRYALSQYFRTKEGRALLPCDDGSLEENPVLLSMREVYCQVRLRRVRAHQRSCYSPARPC
jgi:hypothetical protein